MDRKLPKSQEIDRLIRLAESARSTMESEAISLKHRLDVPSRIRDSLRTHPTGWLFGSVASGLAASLLFRRKPARAEKPTRGMALTLLGLLLTVVRPMAKVWLTGQLKNFLAARSHVQDFNQPAVEATHSPTSFQ